jgi:hypothetical protein
MRYGQIKGYAGNPTTQIANIDTNHYLYRVVKNKIQFNRYSYKPVSTLFFLPLLDSVPNHDKCSRIQAKITKPAPHTLSYMSCKSVATLVVRYSHDFTTI